MTNKAIKLRKGLRFEKKIQKRNPNFTYNKEKTIKETKNPWRLLYKNDENYSKVKTRVKKIVVRWMHLSSIYWYLIPKLKGSPRPYLCKGTSSSKNTIAKMEALERLKRIYQ